MDFKYGIELWKEIDDYPRYEVSNYGRVRYTPTGKIRKFNITISGNIFTTFHLSDDTHISISNNHLVYNTFIDDTFLKRHRNEKLIIECIDGDRTNLHVSNLKCTTYHNRTIDAFIRGERKAKITKEVMNAIFILFKNGLSATNIAKTFNVNKSTIHYILNEKNIQRFKC